MTDGHLTPDPALAKLPAGTVVLAPTAIDFVSREGGIGLQVETAGLGTFLVPMPTALARTIGRNLVRIADAQTEGVS